MADRQTDTLTVNMTVTHRPRYIQTVMMCTDRT